MTTNRNRNKQSSDFINPRAQRQLEMAEKRSVAAQLRRSAAYRRAAMDLDNSEENSTCDSPARCVALLTQ